MRVLLLCNHLNYGGIASYIYNLAKFLTKKGVYVVVASTGGAIEGEIKALGVRHYKIFAKTKNEFNPKLIIAYFQLKKILKNESINLIHANTRVTQVLSWFLSRNNNCVFVSTTHGFYIHKRLSRKLFVCAGKFSIAISRDVAKHMEKDLKIPKERIVFLHNGIDVERFCCVPEEKSNSLKAELGIPQSCFVVGSISRLSKIKGHVFLLHAIKQILHKRKDLVLLIVGNGPERTNLIKLAKELGIDSNVKFLLPTFHTESFFSIFDVFCAPSLEEGLGLSLLEAMSSGRACIASRTGGMEDIIINGENGFLVTPGDADEIASAITMLLENPSLRNKFYMNAKETILKDFGLEEMGEKTLDFYKKALKDEK